MASDYSEIQGVLTRINSQLLHYVLDKLDPPADPPKVDTAQAAFNRTALEDLGNLTDEFFLTLFTFKDREKRLDTGATNLIIQSCRDAAEQLDSPDFAVKYLQRLRKEVVEYHQECLLQKVDSHLSALPTAFRGMLAEPEADRAFPLQYSDEIEQRREDHMQTLKDMVRDGGPDRLQEYVGYVRELTERSRDIKDCAAMLKMIAERTFFWALRPSDVNEDAALEEKYGKLKHGYARMLLQLEEMNIRLAAVSHDWEGLLVRVFKDDYAEQPANEEERLKRLRDGEIGTEKLLDDIAKGETILPNIISQVAVEGPKHLHMTQNYVDMLIRKIHKEVFGREGEIREYTPPKKMLVVTRPRMPVVWNRELAKRNGMTDEQLDDYLGLGEGRAMVQGIMSEYIIIETPLEPYTGKQLEGVGKDDAGVYIASKARVIDFYRSEEDIPEELREGFRSRMASNSTSFLGALSKAKLPSGFCQVSLPYAVVMRKEREVKSARMKDSRSGSAIVDICITTIVDMGAHSTLLERVKNDPRCTMLSYTDFVSRARRSIPPEPRG